MGKKSKASGSGGTSVIPQIPQKDLYQRINFAVQASTFLQSLAGPSNTSQLGVSGANDNGPIISDRKGKRRARDVDEIGLSGLAMKNMRSTKKMSAHTQLKLDPSLKRALCGSCGTVLVQGLTARIRNRPDRRTMNVTHTTCLQCSHRSTLPIPIIQSVIEKGLDGSIRTKRKNRIAKTSKVVFHERERTEAGAQGEHTLWQDGKLVQGWGAVSFREDLEQPSEDET